MRPFAPPPTRIAAPLREQVVTWLRKSISEGRFEPGERLVERELCELTKVSRPLVREVLRQLEVEGLVVTVPQKGVIVVKITPAEAMQIYQVRGVLEGLAARLFAQNGTAAQKEALAENYKRLARAYASDEIDILIAAKAEFYDALLSGGGNEIAHRLLRQLHLRTSLLRATALSTPGRRRQSLAEVKAIVDAVVQGDPERAWSKTVEHIDRASSVAASALSSSRT